MPQNKNAVIRYQTLDKCFSDFRHRYYMDDLIEACAQALIDYTGTDSVSRRTVFDDITFMESSQGWSIPLERIKDGKKVYYRYKYKDFTINNKELTADEISQLKTTIMTISRYRGLPSTEWLEDVISNLEYRFDHLARVIDKFTETIGLTKFAMYVFDYGAPIGYRLAMWHPERITAIISQNGNMYEEGLGKKWEARKAYWKNPTDELRQQFATAYALETIIGQYTFGTPEGSVGPDGYSLDYYYVCQPGRAEMQNDLILDYRSNVALYPEFQQYLRTYQPPLLAVWGENDPSFIPAGAKAFKRDVPNAEIHFVPNGHFALESHHTEIAKLIIDFLHRVL